MICRNITDDDLANLDNFNPDYEAIFDDLKNYTDKFTKAQLNYLCEIALNRNFSKCADMFKYILDVNEIDSREYIFNRLIDNKLNYLNRNPNDISWIIADLNVYADSFSENQIIQLCIFIKDKMPFYMYSKEFINILRLNKDKFSENNYEKYYLEFVKD